MQFEIGDVYNENGEFVGKGYVKWDFILAAVGGVFIALYAYHCFKQRRVVNPVEGINLASTTLAENATPK